MFQQDCPNYYPFMICSPVHADEEFVFFSSLRVMDSPLDFTIRMKDGSILAMYSKKPTAIPFIQNWLMSLIS